MSSSSHSIYQINCINIDGDDGCNVASVNLNGIDLVIIEFETQIGDNMVLRKN